MALNERDVRRIADYARIALDQEQLEEMTVYMNDAMNMLAPILDNNLEDVEPTSHPIGDLSNVMREDVVGKSFIIEECLHNAPSSEGRYFRVPSILGGGEE